MINYSLKVQEIIRETNDTVTLCFKQPGLKKIKYLAGQYLTLSFRINGRKYLRPYSFSSSPSVDSFLEITVKRVPDGIVSNYINDKVNCGDIIEVMEPMGDFVYTDCDKINQLYFWGVGSGITPLFSIIKQVLTSKPSIQIILVYGNKTIASTIFFDAINILRAKYPNNFKVWYFYSQMSVQGDDFFKEDRINKDFILDVLKGAAIANTAHYICGPIDLKNTVKSALIFLNCPIENIFSEDFELVKDPKDFEDITEQKVKINFLGNETVVLVKKGVSVLESALDAALELPYSCQTGNCDTCKGTLESGKLKMIGLSKERDDLAKNDFLLCCSYPLTEDVYIKI